MLTVTKAGPWEQTIITVDRQVSSGDVELIESNCHKAQSSGKQVYLLLRNIAAIDDAGRAMLRRLAAEGVQLVGKGVHTCYLVRALRPPDTQVFQSAVTNGLSDRYAIEEI